MRNIIIVNATQLVTSEAKPCYVVQNPNCCPSQTFGCGCGAVA